MEPVNRKWSEKASSRRAAKEKAHTVGGPVAERRGLLGAHQSAERVPVMALAFQPYVYEDSRAGMAVELA